MSENETYQSAVFFEAGPCSAALRFRGGSAGSAEVDDATPCATAS